MPGRGGGGAAGPPGAAPRGAAGAPPAHPPKRKSPRSPTAGPGRGGHGVDVARGLAEARRIREIVEIRGGGSGASLSGWSRVGEPADPDPVEVPEDQRVFSQGGERMSDEEPDARRAPES